MKINRNMSAVVANTHLLQSENRLRASIERLSSGYKINSAVDNPAGMAISNKMKAQIDALNQAENNSNDGVSVLQIADGALNEVASVLQRIRELSVQGANDSNTYSDRQSIQAEIEQLKKEVDRVSKDTEYNTKILLDGSSDTRTYSDDVTRVNISDNVPADTYNVNVLSTAFPAEAEFNVPDIFTAEGTITINTVSVDIAVGMTKEDFLYQFSGACEEAGVRYNNDGGKVIVSSERFGDSAKMDISISKELVMDISMPELIYNSETEKYEATYNGANAKVEVGEGFSENATTIVDGNRVYVRDSDGFKLNFLINSNLLSPEANDGETLSEKEIAIEVTEIGRLTIQTGANQYQQMDIRIPEISVESLYLDTVDVTVVGGASYAIGTLDEAIAELNSVRSRIGAFQNRLEYASASLAETQENMTAAFSQILDTDMAEEMTEYANQNIINQASISVLSQANDMPKQVLSLLSS